MYLSNAAILLQKRNTTLMFETLLDAPSSDEDAAQEWNSKRLYAMKKVCRFSCVQSDSK
jgi:hypothetical protein